MWPEKKDTVKHPGLPRRKFLKWTGLTALSVSGLPDTLFANRKPPVPAPIAIQLYTVRRVKVAGHDPAKIVAQFGKRAQLLHIKDGPAKWNDLLPSDNPDPMTAAGKGTQDFPAIVKAARGNTEWMVVEMDLVATDLFTAIRDSYSYLIKNGLARGKKPG